MGTGACFEARFAELEPWLAERATGSVAGSRHDRAAVRRQLACTLTCSMSWASPEGRHRQETRTAPVVPLPDLAIEVG